MSGVDLHSVPALRRGVRLTLDGVRQQPALLYPEGVLLLNDTAAAVIGSCDGVRDVSEIAAELAIVFDGVEAGSITTLVDDLVARHLVTLDPGLPRADTTAPRSMDVRSRPADPLPVGLLAELTYRCPLRCTYCSNPMNMASYRDELTTDDWSRVFDQSRELGVLQVHFSGGEPLLRRDLPQLVAQAHQRGMYTSLVTSGIPLTEAAVAALVDAGLDHLQLSIQDAMAAPADEIAGIRAHDRKLAAAELIRRSGLPLTVNVVLHAGNVERVEAIADLAARLGAERLELAHTQYYGWAMRNRSALMPTPRQVERAGEAAAAVRARHGDQMEIVYVQPDYHTSQPKPCMYGWGLRQFVVAPNGDMLPCLAAGELPGLDIRNVRAESVADIWYRSGAFEAYRATAWMKSPCRDCALREVDFGGCRCQAFALTGDPAATDPVCVLSPDHHLVTTLAQSAGGTSRTPPTPRRFR